MRFVIYAGPAPSYDAVITFSAPLLRQVARAVTLVSGGGAVNEPLLRTAQAELELPSTIPTILRIHDGDAVAALTWEAGLREADLIIIGRLQPSLQRIIMGRRSKRLAQRLDVAVIRVQGRIAPIRRILLASGGDAGTLAHARYLVRLAKPLGASVTLLHTLSEQPIIFESSIPHEDAFLNGPSPEAAVLRESAALLREAGVATQVVVKIGSVVDCVVDAAREHDLLMIGAHRVASRLDRILLEDLAGDLLDLSPIPVLVGKRGEG
ncbi:UspA domain-containing protein [Oscillochloris trichoides DG-6]|uniref:UspA domain-containing protein n=1 Tax=Oscillochloris trichoides DG-6 TaxID=765420 RepID=E1IBF2_9CHLR|nr:universal stress protein [Oscillochloris trichoides]EFO81509.1 UspA domain-containing protein [Oscillochloris trichoides DG-6]